MPSPLSLLPRALPGNKPGSGLRIERDVLLLAEGDQFVEIDDHFSDAKPLLLHLPNGAVHPRQPLAMESSSLSESVESYLSRSWMRSRCSPSIDA